MLNLQLNVASAELSQRYENMGENLSQADAAKDRLSSQLEAAETELESLKKPLAEAQSACELEKKKAAELTSQLETEQRKFAELPGQIEAAREEGRQLGIKDFKKSEGFLKDLALLNGPILQVGYARAMHDVQSLTLLEFDLGR
mgnify:CR=1 FL=1